VLCCRSEKVWKSIGKSGLAVKARWPEGIEVNKLLTRQAKFLRDSLKNFRALVGKAKKGAEKSTILVTDSYPSFKVTALLWMQEKYDADAGFPATFMKDLKDWTGETISDKKLIKVVMQFVSFMKKEVEDVGAAAMETSLPFDQMEILKGSEQYIKTQLNLKDLTFINVGSGDDKTAGEVPDRVVDNVTPGKPYLWLR
jgi:leucyl-tRNA synthetase